MVERSNNNKVTSNATGIAINLSVYSAKKQTNGVDSLMP
jgi:hypothetical protein